MEHTFSSRLKHAWNAFLNKDPTSNYTPMGSSYYYRPDRPRMSRGNERSIVTSVYNRIALDVAAITIQHCKLDENGRFIEAVNSKLNSCLNLEANIDQTGRAFRQDIVMSMFDEGCVAIVPVDTTFNPNTTGAYDILSMRTAKVIQWYPQHVKLRLYNDRTGEKDLYLQYNGQTKMTIKPRWFLLAINTEKKWQIKHIFRHNRLITTLIWVMRAWQKSILKQVLLRR